MTTNPELLRTLADDARAVAARELADAKLYSVLVDLADGEWATRPRSLRFGFQELKRGFLLGTRLRTCWVELCSEPRALTVLSAGTYGRRQFMRLATLPGLEFPPPTLDLSRLRLEIPDVVTMLKRMSRLGETMGTLALSVCVHDGHVAWRALQEVAEVGFSTLLIDAADGHVLYEKVDWWQSTPEEPGRPRRPDGRSSKGGWR